MTMNDRQLSSWEKCQTPGDTMHEGMYCRLELLDWDVHGEALFDAIAGDDNASLWQYIPLGPFEEKQAFVTTLNYVRANMGWRTMVIVAADGNDVLGMASYMRIREEHGSAEVGCIVFGPALQRTRAATEAIFLMASHVFDDLGYRRFEWKCNNANQASRDAAVRFGFTFEGVFRKDMVMKGQNRDTAWYSITDDEWPALRRTYRSWLSPNNFTENGIQKRKLSECMQG